MDLIRVKYNVIDFLERPNTELWGDTSFILPFEKTDTYWIIEKTFPSFRRPPEVEKELFFESESLRRQIKNYSTKYNLNSCSTRWVELKPGEKFLDSTSLMSIIITKGNLTDNINKTNKNILIKDDNIGIDERSLTYSYYLYCPIEVQLMSQNFVRYYKFEGEILNSIGDYGVIQEAISSTSYNKVPVLFLIDGKLRKSLENNGFIVLGVEGALEVSIFKKVIRLKEACNLHRKFLALGNWLYTKDFRKYHNKEAFRKTWLRLYKLIF